jgi:hypothetical protein
MEQKVIKFTCHKSQRNIMSNRYIHVCILPKITKEDDISMHVYIFYIVQKFRQVCTGSSSIYLYNNLYNNKVGQSRTKSDKVGQSRTKSDKVGQSRTKSDKVGQSRTKLDHSNIYQRPAVCSLASGKKLLQRK